FAGRLVAVEPGELSGILRVVNRYGHERFRALAHQARVRAGDPHHGPARPGEGVYRPPAPQPGHDLSLTTSAPRRALQAPPRDRGGGDGGWDGRAPWRGKRSSSGEGAAVASTMRGSSRPGNEIRRKPRPDIAGDSFRCAQLCVTQTARAGVGLFLAGNVIRDVI